MKNSERGKFIRIVYGVSGCIYGVGKGFLFGVLLFTIFGILSYVLPKNRFVAEILLYFVSAFFLIFLPSFWGYKDCRNGVQFYSEHRPGGGGFIGGAMGLLISYVFVFISLFLILSGNIPSAGGNLLLWPLIVVIFVLKNAFGWAGMLIEWYLNRTKNKGLPNEQRHV